MQLILCRFHRDSAPHIHPDGVSAPTLEALLLEIFQREFLELLTLIKRQDYDETGLISLVIKLICLMLLRNLESCGALV